jgi:trimeric autotransporter adhesin
MLKPIYLEMDYSISRFNMLSLMTGVLLFIVGCNPMGETKIQEAFMPGVNASRIIKIYAGDGQVAPHGQALPSPFVIIVKDDLGKVIPNQKIIWSILTAEGSLSVYEGFTDVNGLNSSLLSLGTPGLHKVRAKIAETSSEVVFEVSAVDSVFSSNWNFGISGDYSYDSNFLEVISGVARLKAFDQTDDDNSVDGFGSITQTGVVWDATNEVLRLTQSSANNTLSALDASWTPKFANIIQYIKFDGTLGPITSGSTITATIGNNITVTGSGPQYVDGKINQGINLNGTNDRFTIGCDTSFSNTFTFSAWVKPGITHQIDAETATGTGGTAGQRYVHYPRQSGTNGGAGVSVGTNGISVYEHGNAYMPALAVYNGVVGTEWSHVVVVYDNKRPSIYLNGTLVRVGLLSTKANVYPPCTDTNNYGHFLGGIDEFVTWNTNLTAEEIKAIYKKQAPLYRGEFSSRIMEASNTSQVWNSLNWSTTLPFLKELPSYVSGVAQNESSSSYSQLVGSTSNIGDDDLMDGVIGLYHFNEASATAGAGNDLKDDAGSGIYAEAFAGVTFGEEGRFKNALKFDGSTGYVNTGRDLSWNKTQSFSISFWIRPDHLFGNQGIMGKGQAGGYGTANWEWSFRITNGSLDFSYWNTAAAQAILVTTSVTVGVWDHITLVYNGSSEEARLYKNGTLVGIDNSITGTLQDRATPVLFGHAYFNAGVNNYFNGALDEIIFWNKPLTATEIHQLQRRGNNRINLQARTCLLSDCSDDATGVNWKGPDGTINTYFSEINNSALTSPSLTLSGFTGKYFQYRGVFESDDRSNGCNYGSGSTWCSPEIKNIIIGPDHFSLNQSIVTNNGIPFYRLSSLTEILGTSCSAGIGYNISLDKTNWYYWNGSAWIISDGSVIQSNSAATISGNAASFHTSVGSGSIYLKAFLESDGSSSCELDELQINGSN